MKQTSWVCSESVCAAIMPRRARLARSKVLATSPGHASDGCIIAVDPRGYGRREGADPNLQTFLPVVVIMEEAPLDGQMYTESVHKPHGNMRSFDDKRFSLRFLLLLWCCFRSVFVVCHTSRHKRMGHFFSSAEPSPPRSSDHDYRRPRTENDDEETGGQVHDDSTDDALLSMRFVTGPHAGSALCGSVVRGAEVEAAYGCHGHLYPTGNPTDTHGASLAWELPSDGDAVGTLQLLTVCRVANACRKTALLTDGRACGVVLEYTADL